MIRLEKVTKTVTSGAERLTILDAVDLFVPAGQFIAVTGPSGSGKSTLLSLVAGLDAPTSGDVYLAQQRITRMRENALADLRGAMVGIVFQSFHLIPSLTAYENVLVPMELAGQPTISCSTSTGSGDDADAGDARARTGGRGRSPDHPECRPHRETCRRPRREVHRRHGVARGPRILAPADALTDIG
jgi:ABC-type sugar transport system ATPase subunit